MNISALKIEPAKRQNFNHSFKGKMPHFAYKDIDFGSLLADTCIKKLCRSKFHDILEITQHKNNHKILYKLLNTEKAASACTYFNAEQIVFLLLALKKDDFKILNKFLNARKSIFNIQLPVRKHSAKEITSYLTSDRFKELRNSGQYSADEIYNKLIIEQ